jgi:hypothetical protein
MAADLQRLKVDTTAAMEASITSYISDGYVVVNKTATSATLIKRKQFSTLWAVIGFLVCVVPLLVYLIVYASQKDKVIEITVAA